MRYNLKGVFVFLSCIAVTTCWVGWQYRIVTERRAICRALMGNDEGTVIFEGTGWGENFERIVEADESRRINIVRRWLGDENAQAIVFNSAASPKRLAIEAFPEANVYIP